MKPTPADNTIVNSERIGDELVPSTPSPRSVSCTKTGSFRQIDRLPAVTNKRHYSNARLKSNAATEQHGTTQMTVISVIFITHIIKYTVATPPLILAPQCYALSLVTDTTRCPLVPSLLASSGRDERAGRWSVTRPARCKVLCRSSTARYIAEVAR